MALLGICVTKYGQMKSVPRVIEGFKNGEFVKGQTTQAKYDLVLKVMGWL